jgi:hypothetical protein
MAYTKYSLTPANNNAAPPDGAPEGMLPSAVNDTMRDMMAQIRDCGDGIRGGTYTMTAPVITGGSINGAAIGATTASTGKFSALTNTALTAGRVTYAGTGGLLTDASTFTYDGTVLVVSKAAGTPYISLSNGTGNLNVGVDSADSNIAFLNSNNNLKFLVSSGSTEVMRLTTAGNVGINTSTPLTKLDVVGPASVTSFTGTTKLGFTIQGATSTNDYSGIDFTQSGNSPRARIAALFSSSGSFLQFGTSNLYASGVTNAAMTIDYLGNVGIGTSAPSAKLEVASANKVTDAIGNLFVSTTDAVAADKGGVLSLGGLYVGSASYAFGAIAGRKSTGGSDAAGYLTFATTNSGNTITERMRIDSSGILFVGTTTTSYAAAGAKTNINGGGTSALVTTTSGGASYACQYVHNTATSGNNEFITFGTEGTWTARGAINYNRGAGLVAYNTTSDYRAKNILGNIENAIGTVNNLKVHNAIMKEATIERPMFVAHELQVEAPYAVTGEKDAEDKDGNPVYQQVDASSLVPLLTKAIQEQQVMIEELKAKVAALEAA